MPDPLIDRTKDLVDEWLKDTDGFLVDLSVLPGNKIQVFIDADSEITISQCAKLSRHLENTLEEEGLVGEVYTMEVSSPGGEMAFKMERQFKKNVGREVAVVMKDGLKHEGVLKEMIDQGFTLTTKVQSKSNKKQFVPKDITIELSEVKSVKKLYKI